MAKSYFAEAPGSAAPPPGDAWPAAPAPDYVRLFEELSGQVRDAGLLRPRPRLYLAWMAANASMLAVGWAAMLALGDTWQQLFVAAYLAFWGVQIGLVGHDSGHGQVFRRRASMDAAGYLQGNLLIGVSHGWWVGHHNRHHSHPNHLEHDPDIVRRQVIFSARQAPLRTGAIDQFIIRHQAWLFFGLGLIEGWRMHLAGFIAAAKGGIKRRAAFDVALLAAHLIAYFVAVFSTLSAGKAVAFVLLHQGLFGFYLRLNFAAKHQGMPVRAGAHETLDWLPRQLLTSRNVRPNRVLDFLFCGLNYQIEHHLFPTMPSINLRRSRPVVKAFCERHGLPYAEVSALESYRMVSVSLGRVSAEARRLEEVAAA